MMLSTSSSSTSSSSPSSPSLSLLHSIGVYFCRFLLFCVSSFFFNRFSLFFESFVLTICLLVNSKVQTAASLTVVHIYIEYMFENGFVTISKGIRNEQQRQRHIKKRKRIPSEFSIFPRSHFNLSSSHIHSGTSHNNNISNSFLHLLLLYTTFSREFTFANETNGRHTHKSHKKKSIKIQFCHIHNSISDLKNGKNMHSRR